jgi:hypothetical protein
MECSTGGKRRLTAVNSTADNFVARSLSNDIFEWAARRDSSGPGFIRQIEIAVRQSFPYAVSLLLRPSAPKLRLDSWFIESGFKLAALSWRRLGFYRRLH